MEELSLPLRTASKQRTLSAVGGKEHVSWMLCIEVMVVERTEINKLVFCSLTVLIADGFNDQICSMTKDLSWFDRWKVIS